MRALLMLLAGSWLLAASGLSEAADARGARSCQKWADERRSAEAKSDLNKVPVLITKSWFLGYLSGRASRSAQDFLKGTDNESIFLWLDKYCKEHPLQDLDSGAIALESELAQIKASH